MSDIPGSSETQTTTSAQAASNKNAANAPQRAAVEFLTEKAQQNIQARIDRQERLRAQVAKTNQNPPKSVRVKGTVTQHSDGDKTRYTIKTEEGTITLRTPSPRQPRPPVGQEVTVDIALDKGRVPAQGDAQIYQGAPPRSNDEAIELRPSTTPLDVDIQIIESRAQAGEHSVKNAAYITTLTTQISPLPAQSEVSYFQPPAQPQQTQLPAQYAQSVNDTLPPGAKPNTPPSQALQAPGNPVTPPLNNLPLEQLSQPALIPAETRPLPGPIAQRTANPTHIIKAITAAQPALTPATASTLTAQQTESPAHKTALHSIAPATLLPLPATGATQNAAQQATILTSQSSAPPLHNLRAITVNIPHAAHAVTLPPAGGEESLFTPHLNAHNAPLKAGDVIAQWVGHAPAPDKADTYRPVLHIQPHPQPQQSAPLFTSPYSPPPGLLPGESGGLFLLHTALPESVPTGASLTLSPQPAPGAAGTPLALPDIPAGMQALPIWGPILLNTQSWDNLNALHQTLLQTAPQSATMMANISPSPANLAQMMPAALFFISAIKGGDISQWMGDRTIDALKKAGKHSLLSALTKETGALSRLANEPVGEWRTHALPLYHDGTFHKILLHSREDSPHDDGDDAPHNTTRFIFDLTLAHIGPVQLDGLFRDKRLDVILRTTRHFSGIMQAEMRRLYAQALEHTPIKGDLSFQNNPEQWVTIQEDPNKTLTQKI